MNNHYVIKTKPDFIDNELLQQEMSQCDQYNCNAWLKLTQNNNEKIFQDLLNKNILPTTKDLSVRSKNGINTWSALAMNSRYSQVFITLLNKNIIPSREDLSHFIDLGNNLSINAWDGLIDLEDPLIIQTLFNKGVVPYLHDLSKNFYIKLLNKPSFDFIFKRLNRLEQFQINYPLNLNFTMIDLLSYEKKRVDDYYGFLYLFYLNVDILPPELWLHVGSYLLPNNINMKDVAADESHGAFVKYHMFNALTHYSACFFTKHNERAKSLLQFTTKSDDPRPTFINQYYWSIGKKYAPKQYHKNSVNKFQQPYSKPVTKATFYQLLREGFFLSYKKLAGQNRASSQDKNSDVGLERVLTTTSLRAKRGNPENV